MRFLKKKSFPSLLLMSNIPDSPSSSDDDYCSSDSSDTALRSAGPEVFTHTLKQQLETEDSITSLFHMHNMLASSKDYFMYVFFLISYSAI